jgi:hypothetical protein
MRTISPLFLNRSRKSCKNGVHTTRANVFCTTKSHTHIWNILHVDNLGEIILMCHWYLWEFVKHLFWFVWITIETNCWYYHLIVLGNQQLLYLTGRAQTFRLCIHLFSEIYFCYLYRLKSWRIATIWAVKCRELDASLLYLCICFIFLLTLKIVFLPQSDYQSFRCKPELQLWNIRLRTFVEDKWMFSVHRVIFVLITETDVENSMSLNIETLRRIIFRYTEKCRYKQLQWCPIYFSI